MSRKELLEATEREGQIFRKGNRVFVYVTNKDASIALKYGYPVVIKHDESKESIQQPTTASLHAFAGTPMNPSNTTDPAYEIAKDGEGWICVGGPAQIYTKGDGTAIAAGDSLKCVNSANYMVKSQGAGTEPDFYFHAQALEANTAANYLTDVLVKGLTT
jgi:hypothetical protein